MRISLYVYSRKTYTTSFQASCRLARFPQNENENFFVQFWSGKQSIGILSADSLW